MKNINKIILLLTLSPATLAADTIYKSVDENGHVTYSTTPPKDSEKSKSVDITPPPSDERIKAAEDRKKRNQEAADILDENRNKRDEITAEENRLKRENQKQLQQQQQAEKNNENTGYGYPYYQRRPAGRPVVRPPVATPHR